jgi:hypothetical protein
MTTVSGSTPSSPDTRSIVKPLEEAPFREYLRILRENNHAEDALVSEEFYISLLVDIDLGDGKILTKEQVYALPFKDLVKAGELVLKEMNRQISEAMPPTEIHGPMLVGPDADKLSSEQLQYLINRQAAILEEEKARLGYG